MDAPIVSKENTMTTQIRLAWLVALTLLLMFPGGVLAQATKPTPPAPPPEASTDVGNWGTIPYVARDLILRAEDKAALRKLEDKHVQELRALEDKLEREFRALRAKQSAEREALLKAVRK